MLHCNSVYHIVTLCATLQLVCDTKCAAPQLPVPHCNLTLIYLSGHGLPHSGHRLLALPSTRTEEARYSISMLACSVLLDVKSALSLLLQSPSALKRQADRKAAVVKEQMDKEASNSSRSGSSSSTGRAGGTEDGSANGAEE